jgi:hypothetical protein
MAATSRLPCGKATAQVWEVPTAETPQLQEKQQVAAELLAEDDLLREPQEEGLQGVEAAGPAGELQQALQALRAALRARLPQDLQGLSSSQLATAALAMQQMRLFEPELMQVRHLPGSAYTAAMYGIASCYPAQQQVLLVLITVPIALSWAGR